MKTSTRLSPLSDLPGSLSCRWSFLSRWVFVAALGTLGWLDACKGEADGDGGAAAEDAGDTGQAGGEDGGDAAQSEQVLACGLELNAPGLVAHDDDAAFSVAQLDLDSCAPDPAPPEGGCTVTIRGQVIDFREDRFMGPDDDFDLTGTSVKVYFDNVIEGLGDESDFETTADNQGNVELADLPCNTRVAILAYKQTRPPITKPTIEYNFWTGEQDRSRVEFVTISVVSYQLIPGVLGIDPDLQKGILAGRFYDCSGHFVENALFQVTSGHNSSFEPAKALCNVAIHYFIDEWPDRDQLHTSPDGLYIAINVPPGPATIHVVGRSGPDEEPAHVGAAQVHAVAGSIAFSDTLPWR